MPDLYRRQHGFFDPAHDNPKVVVVGAGSLGSNIVFLLAKMGVQDIKVYDGDDIEEHNLPNQMYTHEQVGLSKVVALSENLNMFGQNSFRFNVGNVTDKVDIPNEAETIYILATDTLESRRLVYGLIEFFPMHLIDARSGGEGYQIYYVDLMNDEMKAEYVKTLEGEDGELKCGEQTVIYNVMSAAAEVCNLVKRISKGQTHATVIKREMSVPRIIGR